MYLLNASEEGEYIDKLLYYILSLISWYMYHISFMAEMYILTVKGRDIRLLSGMKQ